MIATLERNPEVGIANPRGNERSENLKIKDADLYARKLEEVNHEGFTELDHASGFCMLIKRQVIDKLGNLDEIYEFGHYEDHDYSKHAQREGYWVIQCDDAFVLHYGGVSFKKVPELRKQMIERNRSIYEQRWGRQLRFLVLMKTSDPECLLEIARKGYLVYVIGNGNIAPDKFTHPHQNIRLLNSWVCKINETLYFLFKAYYLRRKKRIDHALILFSRNICEMNATQLSRNASQSASFGFERKGEG